MLGRWLLPLGVQCARINNEVPSERSTAPPTTLPEDTWTIDATGALASEPCDGAGRAVGGVLQSDDASACVDTANEHQRDSQRCCGRRCSAQRYSTYGWQIYFMCKHEKSNIQNQPITLSCRHASSCEINVPLWFKVRSYPTASSEYSEGTRLDTLLRRLAI